MTDNEIIKTLERCSDGTGKGIIKATLDLIKRKDEQIEALIAGQETLQKYIAEKDAEIEKYKETVGELDIKDGEVVALLNGKETAYINKGVAKTLKRMAVKTAKSEAVKEFAEDIINNILPKFMTYGHEEIALRISFAISRKAKEMVGEYQCNTM